MKKSIWFVLLILFSSYAFAQSTSVTATITDTDGQVWAYGTAIATFVPGPTSAYRWSGGSIPNQVTASMDGTGTFTMSIPDNTTITPVGSAWRFSICPDASSPCVSKQITVAGSSMNLSTQLSSVAQAPRFPATPWAYGYSDAEIQPKPVPGGMYWNVISSENRCWNGSSWITCSGSASFPTGTTDQLLYYATSGTTLTPLTLGTNLSITSGTLNAAGGSSVNVNGSAVTNPNFNGTTPAAPSGDTNVTWQVSGSSVSGYVPTATSGGNAIKQGSQIWLIGDSWLRDDDNVLSPALTVSSWSCNGATNSTCTITFASAPAVPFVAGDWIDSLGLGSPFWVPNATAQTEWGSALPQGGDQQVLSTGLTSTTIEVQIGATSSASCSSSCGTVDNAEGYQGPQLQTYPGISGVATVNWQTCTGYSLQDLALYSSTCLANIPTGTSGAPVYLVVVSYSNDFKNGRTASQMHTDMQTLEAYAHSRGMIFVAGDTFQNGYPTVVEELNSYLREDATAQQANASTGDYIDLLFDPVGQVGANTSTYMAANGGATYNGIQLLAQDMRNAMVTGVSQLSSEPAAWSGGSYVDAQLSMSVGAVPYAFSVNTGSSGSYSTSFMVDGNNKTIGIPGLAPASSGGDTCLHIPYESLGDEAGDIYGTGYPCAGSTNAFNMTNYHTLASGTPTIAAGAGAGTSPTVSVSGNDEDGYVEIQPGTTPAASTTVATITMANACPAGITPVLQPANAATSALTGAGKAFAFGDSTTAWEIDAGSTALPSGIYEWGYHAGCSAGPVLPIVQVTYVAENSTSVASITSPSVNVSAADTYYIACRSGQQSAGNNVASSSLSSTATLVGTIAGPSSSATVSLYQLAFSSGGATTFTCTPPSSIAYQSMTVMQVSGSSTVDTSSVVSNSTSLATSLTSPAFSTANPQEIGLYCASISSISDTFTGGDLLRGFLERGWGRLTGRTRLARLFRQRVRLRIGCFFGHRTPY